MLKLLLKYKFPITIFSLLLISLNALAADLSPEGITTLFSEATNSKIAQAGFFFTVASWLHSSRVKKEIRLNFSGLTAAIENMATAFKDDLRKHADIQDNLVTRIVELETIIKTQTKK